MATLARIAVAASPRSWTSTPRPGEVRRHAEERQPQVARRRRPASDRGDVAGDPLALDQRDDRHRVVEQAVEQLGDLARRARRRAMPQRHHRADRARRSTPRRWRRSSTPSSRRARHTPRWAKPRAPPPPSTSPVPLPDTSRASRPRSAVEPVAHVGDPVERRSVGERRHPVRALGVGAVDERQPALDRDRCGARRPAARSARRRSSSSGSADMTTTTRSARASAQLRPPGRSARPSPAPGSRGWSRPPGGTRDNAGRVTDEPRLDETGAPERGVDPRRPQVARRAVPGDLVGQPGDEHPRCRPAR